MENDLYEHEAQLVIEFARYTREQEKFSENWIQKCVAKFIKGIIEHRDKGEFPVKEIKRQLEQEYYDIEGYNFLLLKYKQKYD